MNENQSTPDAGARDLPAAARPLVEESLTGSAAEILAAVVGTGGVGAMATAAASVAKADIDQKGEARRAEIAADVEHVRIRAGLPSTPSAQADTSSS